MIHCMTLKAMNKKYTLSSGKLNATVGIIVKVVGRGCGWQNASVREHLYQYA